MIGMIRGTIAIMTIVMMSGFEFSHQRGCENYAHRAYDNLIIMTMSG